MVGREQILGLAKRGLDHTRPISSNWEANVLRVTLSDSQRSRQIDAGNLGFFGALPDSIGRCLLLQPQDKRTNRLPMRAAFLTASLLFLLQTGCQDPAEELEGPDPSLLPSSMESETVSVEELNLDQTRQLFSRGDLTGAKEALKQYLLRRPDDPEAMELAGDLASAESDVGRAIEYYIEARKTGPEPSEPLLNKLAMELMKGNRAMESLDTLAERVASYPNQLQARYDLIGLSAMLGFPELAVPSLRWLTQRGKADPEILQVLADPQRVQADDQLCNKLLEGYPQDQRLQYAIARIDASELKWQKVFDNLSQVTEQHPTFLPAHALLGRAMIELNRFDQIPPWQTKKPKDSASSPVYWLVSGAWAEHEKRYPEAAKCYWEGIKLDDTGHPELLQRLARSLRQMNREPEALRVDRQIANRAALRDALSTHFVRSATSQEAAMNVADAMSSLGRLWEAESWARLATTLKQNPLPDLRERYLAIRNQLTVDSPWQDPKRRLAVNLDLAELPSLNWNISGQQEQSQRTARTALLQFNEESSQRGWDHTCEVAPEATTEGHWIYQSMGGGVGVIDFDLDGWPDLAAAMLDGRPLEMNSSANRLFRNHEGRYQESSVPSGYLDTGFGQGITVGDYNNDGFPDIFDCNIGENRLYRNNGDGTFEEVSEALGLEGSVWTTSAALADLDGDGLTDLYETAYCGSNDPYEVPCKNSQGLFSTCTPLNFQAEPDRVWKGRSDGTFRATGDNWVTQETPGRGMGLQVGLLDDRPGLDVYVSNDMTVNHLWSAELSKPMFHLTDMAAVSGVAISGRSFSQASMGIAAGDPDGDGDVDLFVTHFAEDHNTFYEQVGNGIWVDRSFQVGLGEASMKQLGFGAEWMDVDNNGTQELIVTNGHIDDVETKEIAYRMRPQLFEINQSGTWSLIPSESIGNYFDTEHLGRALVTLDADRDGRSDVAITHLYEASGLLMNRSKGTGRSITLRLVATNSQRDAIGAKVSVEINGQKQHHQLFAGDGYMCSNQRHLIIGVGKQSTITNLTIHWPSGLTEELGSLTTGVEAILVEGEQSPFIHGAYQ